MIARGASDIRGIRSLTTRPGSINESNKFLKLYQLAAEKENLQKKVVWVKRQKDQAEKRLAEIAYAVHEVEARAKRETASLSHAGFRSMFIEY